MMLRARQACTPIGTALTRRSYGDCLAPTLDGQMPMMINNEFKMSQAKDHVDIVNPATQEKLSRVPICTQEELQAAAASCQEAFPAWRNTSVSNRVRVMLKWQQLIREHQSTLAEAITQEQGKTIADANG